MVPTAATRWASTSPGSADPRSSASSAELDGVFADRGGRPHWGKLYDADPQAIAARYPRFADFSALATQLDPSGKFRNRTLDGLLGPV